MTHFSRTHIGKLVAQATSQKSEAENKFGKYHSITIAGDRYATICFYEQGNQNKFASLYVDFSTVRLELFRSISKGADFQLAVKERYPSVKVTKNY